MGDFNIDMLKISSSAYTQFTAVLRDYGLINVGTDPTRVTLQSCTQIDLVICNSLTSPFIHSFQSIESGISDHNILRFRYEKNKSVKPPPKIIRFKQLNTTSLLVMKQAFSKISASDVEVMLNKNSTINEYMTKINDLIDSATTTKTYRISAIQHPWITPEFVKLCRHRDKLFHLAKKTNSVGTLSIAKQLRNKCTYLSRNLKKQYIQYNLELYRNNPKKLWSVLRPFLF